MLTKATFSFMIRNMVTLYNNAPLVNSNTLSNINNEQYNDR